MDPGKLITIEGIDGAGKSTLAGGLARGPRRPRDCACSSCASQAGSAAAERIRELVTDPGAANRRACRSAALRGRARPARRGGAASAAGRRDLGAAGSVRGLLARLPGRRPRLGVDAVREINEFAIQGLRPDRTLLLVIDPGDGQARSQARGGPPDRLENEQRDFFEPDRGGLPHARRARPRAHPDDRRLAAARRRPQSCDRCDLRLALILQIPAIAARRSDRDGVK